MNFSLSCLEWTCHIENFLEFPLPVHQQFFLAPLGNFHFFMDVISKFVYNFLARLSSFLLFVAVISKFACSFSLINV